MVQSQIRGGNEIKIRSKDQCRCSDDLITDQTRWKSSQTYHFDFNSQLGELGLPRHPGQHPAKLSRQVQRVTIQGL